MSDPHPIMSGVPPTLVLGVGNSLMGDDGIGIHIARRMAAMLLPSWMEVIDGGTGGVSLLALFQLRERVVIIDAVHADAPPGSVITLTGDRILTMPDPRESAHDESVVSLLRAARMIGMDCHTELFGIVPKQWRTPTLDLSPELQEVLSHLTEQALAFILHPEEAHHN